MDENRLVLGVHHQVEDLRDLLDLCALVLMLLVRGDKGSDMLDATLLKPLAIFVWYWLVHQGTAEWDPSAQLHKHVGNVVLRQTKPRGWARIFVERGKVMSTGWDVLLT